jgi:hypothetical protein
MLIVWKTQRNIGLLVREDGAGTIGWSSPCHSRNTHTQSRRRNVTDWVEPKKDDDRILPLILSYLKKDDRRLQRTSPTGVFDAKQQYRMAKAKDTQAISGATSISSETRMHTI